MRQPLKHCLSTLSIFFGLAHCNLADAQSFSFAAIGDLPYSVVDEQNLTDVLADIDKSQSAFTVHLGDIKSGGESCEDALLLKRISLLNLSQKPLLLAVGDNEWTDCHRRTAGAYQPVERLAFLRKTVFSKPVSLGQQKLAFEQQAQGSEGPSENYRWIKNEVMFIVLNIPGSNNNYWGQFAQDSPENQEFNIRKKFNDAWWNSSLQHAKKSQVKAVVVSFQGNPFEADGARQHAPEKRDGYLEFRDLLANGLKDLNKPALLLHGDTHSHRMDQALKDAEGKPLNKVKRLETFGYPFTRNWVEIKVNTEREYPFEPVIHRLSVTTEH
ncbi:MAG: metallophosphoesterase [Burkholderiales bacterium]|nr:metallophosphoesterase [Burkholderiales bacterium]